MRKRQSIVSRLIVVVLCVVCLFVLGRISGEESTEPTGESSRDWPFHAVKKVALPKIKRSDWGLNEIDAFILARLEGKDLAPAPVASRETLIRRLYLDLIGLPPTVAEVEAFVADDSPMAYEVLVDRLLKDNRYGERWARYWLDLARYADTAGYEGDPDLPHAWRYRDYVIDAFNNDKPYDLFIKEQIAGDEFDQVMGAGELPLTSPERTVAMTFLRLAPFTEPRGDETRHELLSEMTSTVSSVFLGLTVGCAKCHDHKHDDISTRDFYRMKAFFSTVAIPPPERGDGFQIGGSIPAAFYREKEAQWAAAKKSALNGEVAVAKKELAKLTAELQERLNSHAGFGLQALGGAVGNNHVFEHRKANDGILHCTLVNSDGQQWEFFTDGKKADSTGGLAGSNQGNWLGDIPHVRHMTLGQYTEGTGAVKAKAFHQGGFAEILLYDRPLDTAARKELDEYIRRKYRQQVKGQDDEKNTDSKPPTAGLRLWFDASDLAAKRASPQDEAPKPLVSKWTDRIAGVTLAQSDENLQPRLGELGASNQPAVLFDNDFLISSLEDPAFAADQQGAMVVVYSATHEHEGYGFEIGGDGAFLSTFIYPTAASRAGIADVINNASEDRVSSDERRRFQHLSSRERFVGQHLKRLQPVAMSLRHSFGPPYEPSVPVTRVMIRGEYDNPGEAVEAGFLTCISAEDVPAAIRLDPFKRWPTRSRRMALAEWIASAENPMTARVMMNRLWMWHFGRGIVATPSDFGSLSGGPSHPELLDWLANRFVEEKWSIKAMHRLIVTSQTYRQTSVWENKKAKDLDPENTLVWRFRRQRLSAEAVRDTVLAVSGRLNAEQFGLPIFPPLPDGLAERVKYSESKWDTQYGPEGRKRSIYIYQQRTLTMPLMQLFGGLVCEESRPMRRTSVSALQALQLFNGPFVNEESQYFSKRVIEQVGNEPATQIERAFLLALSRRPTQDESDKLVQFLDEYETPLAGMTALCRILYNSNEFLYVD